MNGIGVTVNGEAAPVSFVSNTQINFLVPADIQPGTAKVQTTNNGITSAVVSGFHDLTAPAFFSIGKNAANGNAYVAATHANGSLIGPAGMITGATTTPASPGETIVIYGTGFGQTSPPFPNGQIISSALMLPTPPTFVIDGTVANTTFAGLTASGLYRFNVVVPLGAKAGDDLVAALLGNAETQENAFITIASQELAASQGPECLLLFDFGFRLGSYPLNHDADQARGFNGFVAYKWSMVDRLHHRHPPHHFAENSVCAIPPGNGTGRDEELAGPRIGLACICHR